MRTLLIATIVSLIALGKPALAQDAEKMPQVLNVHYGDRTVKPVFSIRN